MAHDLGGIIHTYLGFDPKKFPSPTQPPPDLVSGAFEHLLAFGHVGEFTEEQLANAVHIDPDQIKGLGPSLDALVAMLLERRAKILGTYETDSVQRSAGKAYFDQAGTMQPPSKMAHHFRKEVQAEHLRGLERIWYRIDEETSRFAQDLVHLIEHLGQKYEVDELAAKYEFTGRKSMTIEEAISIKEELEMIDRLLEQLREAKKNARLGIIDMEALANYAEPGDLDELRTMQQQVQDYLREMAEQQGLEFTRDGYTLSPKALRLFQSRLLSAIFAELQSGRSGRHSGPIVGEGAVELPQTRPYEFGDSATHMDITQSLINAMLRQGDERPLRLRAEDIEIHETRNNPKCATVVILDMSGSMRHGGQYINAKRMGLALDGLLRTEYPGDFLRFIEMYSFAKLRPISEVPALMPKPVTIYDPVVRLRADMSDERITEMDIPPHFTNIQHALQLSRRLLGSQDSPNRQVVLITDGLPTAHFEGEQLFLLYPPHERTEEATMREAHRCAAEGIVINVFLLPSWSQSREDVQFAHRMVEMTGGRVFFTAGHDLDRFVVWDYVARKRGIVG